MIFRNLSGLQNSDNKIGDSLRMNGLEIVFVTSNIWKEVDNQF